MIRKFLNKLAGLPISKKATHQVRRNPYEGDIYDLAEDPVEETYELAEDPSLDPVSPQAVQVEKAKERVPATTPPPAPAIDADVMNSLPEQQMSEVGPAVETTEVIEEEPMVDTAPAVETTEQVEEEPMVDTAPPTDIGQESDLDANTVIKNWLDENYMDPNAVFPTEYYDLVGTDPTGVTKIPGEEILRWAVQKEIDEDLAFSGVPVDEQRLPENKEVVDPLKRDVWNWFDNFALRNRPVQEMPQGEEEVVEPLQSGEAEGINHVLDIFRQMQEGEYFGDDPYDLAGMYRNLLRNPDAYGAFHSNYLLEHRPGKRDNRLNMLVSPNTLADVLMDPAFEGRLKEYLADEGVQQQIEDLTGKRATVETLPNVFKSMRGTHASNVLKDQFLDILNPLLGPYMDDYTFDPKKDYYGDKKDRDEFGKPKKKIKPDSRIGVLNELMQDPNFNQVLDQFMQDPNVKGKLESLTGEQVSGIQDIPNLIDSMKGTDGVRDLWNQFLDIFEPLMGSSTPGAGDSLMDAVAKSMSGGQIPTGIAGFYRRAMNLAAKGKDYNGGSLQNTIGEDATVGDVTSVEQGKSRIDQSETSDEEKEVARQQMLALSAKPMQEIQDFSSNVVDSFYRYFQQQKQKYKDDPTKFNKIKGLETLNVKAPGGGKVKANIGDLLSAYIPAAIDSWKELIVQDAMKSGRRNVLPNIEDGNIKFDVSKVFGSKAFAGRMAELGKIKHYIHDIKDQSKGQLPFQNIYSKVLDQFKDSPVEISKGLVYNTLKEKRDVADALEGIAQPVITKSPKRGKVSETYPNMQQLSSSMQYTMWDSLAPFMDKVVSESGASPYTIENWTSMIGKHSDIRNPIKDSEFEMLEKVENWWDKEIKELSAIMFPDEDPDQVSFFKKMKAIPLKKSKMIWEKLNHREMPDKIVKYLKWMEKNKTRDLKPGLEDDYDHEYQFNTEAKTVHRMMVYAYFNHQKKVAALQSYRNTLIKVASVEDIDAEIASLNNSLDADLHQLLNLL